MYPLKMIGTYLATALVVAAFGGSIGLLIGVFSPGYYIAVFRAADQPGFAPSQVGFGLGLTQGAGAGILVGFLVTTLVAWRDWRVARSAIIAAETGQPSADTGSDQAEVQPDRTVSQQTKSTATWALGFLLAFLWLGSVAGIGSIAFVAGQARSDLIFSANDASRLEAIAQEVVDSDPAFSGIYVDGMKSSRGGTLTIASDAGAVDDATWDRFLDQLRDALGEDEMQKVDARRQMRQP